MKIYNVYSKSNSELVGTIYADSMNEAIKISHKKEMMLTIILL